MIRHVQLQDGRVIVWSESLAQEALRYQRIQHMLAARMRAGEKTMAEIKKSEGL